MVIFNVTILLLLWSFEIIFFNKFYEIYQVKNMNQIASSINKDSSLENIAFSNGVCILKTNSIFITGEYNTKMVGCALNNNNQVNGIMNEFISSGADIKSYEFTNKEKKSLALLYGIKLDNEYVFIYSPLEDTSTISILLKSQLIYITIGAIIVAMVVSYFLSKKITQPITKITKKAKLLGSREKIEFEKNGIKEIDELADALNLAQSEIGKTEELKRDLMANVSHDLKTPLTMIKAYAEMVKDISYKDKEKMDNDLDIIIDETDRLTILVNDILDLSKMQANADTLKMEKYDIVKEINTIIKRYEIIKETEDYQFILDLPSKAIVKADKNKINQVLYNLINNAINYTGDNKEVYISLKKQTKGYLIEIKDTGKGIKDKDINNIWNKYYKNDKLHQRNVVSTGLGLSIVKEILVMHNFDYGVKTSDKGTIFYFIVK